MNQSSLMGTQPLGKLPYFSDQEYIQRLERVKADMAERGLDACLISVPENIFYLTGLSHQGFFAYHMLVVPRRGQLTLITRSMERATVELQVPSARFIGYVYSAGSASKKTRSSSHRTSRNGYRPACPRPIGSTSRGWSIRAAWSSPLPKSSSHAKPGGWLKP